jgi:hypothetical protein
MISRKLNLHLDLTYDSKSNFSPFFCQSFTSALKLIHFLKFVIARMLLIVGNFILFHLLLLPLASTYNLDQ